MADITQAELNALVTTPSTLYEVTGAKTDEEKRVARDSAIKRTYRVVKTELIGAIRTTKPTEDDPHYMTEASALNHVPDSYRPFEMYGKSFPAVNALPTSEVKGYDAEQVERAKAAVKDFRARRKALWNGLKAERKELFDRWLSGDPKVLLDLNDVSQRDSPVY